MNDALQEPLMKLPLVAILRGITAAECVEVGEMLVEEGFTLIEVPMNSPLPLQSIERLAKALGERALIGAGTVLTPTEVAQVASAGGRLIVSPNAREGVVSAARAAGLVSIPGVATISEALRMIEAGADALKLFPAEAFTPRALKAMRAVLPGAMPVLPVGGIDGASMRAWRDAGAAGFGLGSALYRPGDSPQVIRPRARELVAAWRAL